jgi:hypothetical protein
VEWVSAAQPAGRGYLTVTVSGSALAGVARRVVAAGPACARSDLLRGAAATLAPWPNLAVAPTWRQAWREQAAAMTGRLAESAGAGPALLQGGERRTGGQPPGSAQQSPVAAAAAYHGTDPVRYRLARTLPDRVGRLAADGRAHYGEYAAVRLAHAEASSALRWAGELGTGGADPGGRLADLLGTAPERDLLGLLSWLPVRVAGAARRGRPGELPHFLEQVAAAWTACRLACPALPFGGSAAPREDEQAAARLLLAAAVAAALAAGLALAGIEATGRI